jgi:hypothetical protein
MAVSTRGRAVAAVVAASLVALVFVAVPADAAKKTGPACGDTVLAGTEWLHGFGVDVKSNGPNQGTGESCATGTNTVGDTPSGAMWQCVELVNRLWLTRGWVSSTWRGNGDEMYDTAPAGLAKERNGSVTVVHPGDVISLRESLNGVRVVGGHVVIVDTPGPVTSGKVDVVSQNAGDARDPKPRATYTLKDGRLSRSGGGGGSWTYDIVGVVHAPQLAFSTTSLPSGAQGSLYPATTLQATGGFTPYRWSAAGLPPGVSLNAVSGAVSGVPTLAGSFTVTATVVDAFGTRLSRMYSIRVEPGSGLAYDGGTAFIAGVQHVGVSKSVPFSGGTYPFHLADVTADYPSWLSLSVDGVNRTVTLSGTPTGPGHWELTVVVFDANNNTVSIPVVVDIAADGSPAPFTYTIDPAANGSTAYPTPDGGWLVVGQISGTQTFTYERLSPWGAPVATWSNEIQPLTVVAGAGDEVVVAGLDYSDPESVQIARIGAGGPVLTKSFAPSPYAPGVQVLASGGDGHLYWWASLADGCWISQLDPVTLDVLHRRAVYETNLGMIGGPTALTVVNYAGSMSVVPYTEFSSAHDDEIIFPTTYDLPYAASYLQMSLGIDGSVADMSNRSSACADVTVAHRSQAGPTVSTSFTDVIGDDPSDCVVDDVDALPDGGVVYTMRAGQTLYLVWASAALDKTAMVAVAGDTLNPSTTSDDTGLVATSYTHEFDCPPEEPPLPPGTKCSDVGVVGYREGVEVMRATLAGPRQVRTPYKGLVGRPLLTTGAGALLVEVYESDPNGCSIDNCTPYGVTAEYRTVVADVHVSRHPSFIWW